MKIHIKNISFLLVLIGILGIFLFSLRVKNNTYGNILVIKVFDGDTILLESGEKVRLIGIDCPEAYESDKLIRDARRTGQDNKAIIEMGKKATEVTRNLIEGKRARLEFDIERKDKYGRLLAYIYFKDVCNGGNFISQVVHGGYVFHSQPHQVEINLNEAIIKMGYAQPMTIPPNVKYAELFQKLYREARENKRGLWNL